MSKKNRKKFRDSEDYEDRYENGYHDELVRRRKMKKMKNALRSKHIEDLNWDDYYE